jgi:Family of unknown function (DUF6279)
MIAFLISTRWLRIIGLLLVLQLAGCSAVRLGYNNAPDLAYWWLDGYLDFNSAQSAKVRADLATVQAWHRSQEMPLVLGQLQKLQGMVKDNVTAGQLCDAYDEFKPRMQTLLNQTAPTIGSVAPNLKPEQLTHLAQQLDKRSQKWREEWLDASTADRNARRLKQLVERAEMLYGSLDVPQLTLLRSQLAGSVMDTALLRRESLRRHQDTVQTLRLIQGGGLTADQVRQEVNGLLRRALQSPDAATRSHQQTLVEENCRTYAALHNSTSPQQRARALETLKNYEADARALMAPRP